jgi:hypothetical protein
VRSYFKSFDTFGQIISYEGMPGFISQSCILSLSKTDLSVSLYFKSSNSWRVSYTHSVERKTMIAIPSFLVKLSDFASSQALTAFCSLSS